MNTQNKLLKTLNAILVNAKAEDISTIDLKNKTSVADFFIIATCRSSRHADSTADIIIQELKKLGLKCPNPAGRPTCDWVIVDVGDIIIHLFRPEIRDVYSLEKLWGMNFEPIENQTA